MAAAQALLATALNFPTLARRPRAWRDDDFPAPKREEWEGRAQELARERLRLVRTPLEDEAGLASSLEDSIKALRQRLFEATIRAQTVALFEQRGEQLRSPIEDAATLDALSMQVLAANERVLAARGEERALHDECLRVSDLTRSALASAESLAPRQLGAQDLALLREQSALLGVFRTLIVQSKVDWAKDGNLKEVVLGRW